MGSGCYPLARLLSGRGFSVSGTDASAECESYTDADGIRVWRERSTLPEGTTMAVYSLAISPDDALVLDAKKQGIVLVSRAQLLGALMSAYPVSISVSGSHGKSTTTAIIDHILTRAGRAHTAVSGALLSTGAAYTDGGGDVFLAEACEYKDSFLCLAPTHQIITSVELDHTDYFATLADIKRSFLIAAERAHMTLINADDKVASEIAAEISESRESAKSDTPHGYAAKSATVRPRSPVTYGYSEGADYRIADVRGDGERTYFTITHSGKTLSLTTPLLGAFNLYNVAAAVALADSIGIDSGSIARAVADFSGIDRRLALLTHIGGACVYYDYAHHPSEISAVIAALRERHGTVSVIFRPHTYSRTASLWAEFVSSLSLADCVILLDVYPAREQLVPGVTSQRLAACIDRAVYCPEQSLAAALAVRSGCGAIALLGAGEVGSVRRELINYGQNQE